jgi:hypothetical protein
MTEVIFLGICCFISINIFAVFKIMYSVKVYQFNHPRTSPKPITPKWFIGLNLVTFLNLIALIMTCFISSQAALVRVYRTGNYEYGLTSRVGSWILFIAATLKCLASLVFLCMSLFSDCGFRDFQIQLTHWLSKYKRFIYAEGGVSIIFLLGLSVAGSGKYPAPILFLIPGIYF